MFWRRCALAVVLAACGGEITDGDAGEAGFDAADGQDGGSSLGGDGDACGGDDDCAGGRCVRSRGWTGGYCASPCDGDAACGDGVCASFGTEEAPDPGCLSGCEASSDCRPGYHCDTWSYSRGACRPGAAGIGDACVAGWDCATEACIDDASWPRGYCTAACESETACARLGGDALCVDLGSSEDPLPLCLDGCATDADCRAGYHCDSWSFERPACWPGDAPIGAGCETSQECRSSACAGEENGWVGGACIAYDCDLAAPDASCVRYGGDGVCVELGPPDDRFTACLDRCGSSADCRAGYHCNTWSYAHPVCRPGDAPIGAPCERAVQCAGEYCVLESVSGWPGGYCVAFECDPGAQDTSCAAYGGDAVCVEQGTASDPDPACLDRCATSADCRAGYHCDTWTYPRGVCLPGDAAIGASCTTGAECTSGYCLDEAEWGWPGGTCIARGCTLAAPDASCAMYGGDGVCVDDGVPTCLDRCAADRDCRAGYHCSSFYGQPLCWPGTGRLGAACESDFDCASEDCFLGWPGGFCSGACDPVDRCSRYGGTCGGEYCLAECVAEYPNCRPGYGCLDSGLVSPGGSALYACVPSCGDGVLDPGEECEPPGTATCDALCEGTGTAPVGAPCASAADCAGNHCFLTESAFTGGYCTQLWCDPTDPVASCAAYGPNARCASIIGPYSCYRECGTDADCRGGYLCRAVETGRVCHPG